MTKKYFGTDGIRGKVGTPPITPDFVLKLGWAAGQVFANEGHNFVLVGKDTRISGYMFESALEAGLTAAGVGTRLVGPMPTPAIAYLTRTLHAKAGIVISASHNPFYDNGIKFFSAQGNKLPDAVEEAIEAALETPMLCVTSEKLGRAKRLDDARGRYIEFCKSTFPNELDLRGMKLVVDCAHGAAYHIAPDVFHELGAEVVAIGNQPNGFNINERCGATAPQALSEAVRTHSADLGIALDGDADRLIMVDSSGRVFNGDELLYVMVKDRLANGGVEGAVGTLMTNMAVESAFKSMGVGFARAKVGDRYVLELLQERGWQIGGEGSGHLLFLDKHTTGDGIISALQVLAALRHSGQTLSGVTSDMQLWPQTLLNVKIAPSFDWKTSKSLMAEKERVEAELGEAGRVLIRPSGTEPLLRVMVEAREASLAKSLAERLAACIAS